MNNRKKTRFYKRVFLQSGFDRVGSGKYPQYAVGGGDVVYDVRRF